MGFNVYSSLRPNFVGCAGGRAVMSAARVRPNDACAQCGLLILSGARRHPLRPYCGQLSRAAVAVTPLLTPRQFPYHPFPRLSLVRSRALSLHSFPLLLFCRHRRRRRRRRRCRRPYHRHGGRSVRPPLFSGVCFIGDCSPPHVSSSSYPRRLNIALRPRRRRWRCVVSTV